jgi:hypothetical protein
MTSGTIDIYSAGRWVKAPAAEIDGNLIVVTGRAIRTAAVHDEEWLEGEIQDPETCIERLKTRASHGLRADVFTFAQKLPTTTPRYAYQTEWESVAAIPLSGFTGWWEGLPQETRKNVRRSAKRGVVVQTKPLDDELVRGIAAINNESLLRQGRPFAHYGESFEEVKKDFSSFSDRCELFCAYVGDELVGVLKVMYRRQVASVLKLQSKSSHYDKRPSNALIAAAVEQCDKKGISFITYGKYRYGNQEKTSLMAFKAHHGFTEILVPRFHVPLTTKGRIIIALGLHRGLTGIVPESALSVGRSLRSKWHSLRVSAGVAQ